MKKYYNRHKELQKRNFPIPHQNNSNTNNRNANRLTQFSKKIVITILSFFLLLTTLLTLSASRSPNSHDKDEIKIITLSNINNNNFDKENNEHLVIVNNTEKVNPSENNAIFDVPQEYQGIFEDEDLNFEEIVFELQNYTVADDIITSDQVNKDAKGKCKKNDGFMYQMFYVDLEDNDFDNGLKQKDLKGLLQFKNYRVKKHDTIESISKKFKIRAGTLISLNQLKEKHSLRVGIWVIIPNKNGVLHVVKKGDTFNKICKKYKKFKVSPEEIRRANGLDKSDNLSPGDKIFIPRAKLPESIYEKFVVAEYAKPVAGVITSMCSWRKDPFGSSKWEFHPGVDISAPYGSPVRAAKSGKVKFAGWKGGYGKLVILNHGKNLETRYGHLSKINVKVGQKISKKQVIGKIGSTGHSTGPHLHFEVRKNNKIVDPTSLKGLKGKKYSRYRF